METESNENSNETYLIRNPEEFQLVRAQLRALRLEEVKRKASQASMRRLGLSPKVNQPGGNVEGEDQPQNKSEAPTKVSPPLISRHSRVGINPVRIESAAQKTTSLKRREKDHSFEMAVTVLVGFLTLTAVGSALYYVANAPKRSNQDVQSTIYISPSRSEWDELWDKIETVPAPNQNTP